ncbi:hypothetical protein F4818DRAFT_438550 [Hypoxylon cercidicola]|nr:hypothetical protein F4818DRAFT_438550 [Hypoxylon cercidicola]
MLRAQLRRISLPASRHLSRTSLSKRTFSSYNSEAWISPVPVLKPTLWALAAVTTIYVGCAAIDVRRDVQDAKRRGAFEDGRVSSYKELEEAKYGNYRRHHRSHSPPAPKWQPSGQMGVILSGYDDAEKVVIGAVALNIAAAGSSRFAPGLFAQYFTHWPLFSPNYTLLTSSFGHSGLLHLGLNSLALLSLGPWAASSHLFEGNGSHFGAFYLSAGILSSLGDHIATKLPTPGYRSHRFSPSMGSSGIIMALLGVLVAMHPDYPISTLIPPGTYPMQNYVAALTVFDLFGLIIGIPLMQLAHAAHLTGLGLGIAYVYYDGKKYIWRPSRMVAFSCMKRLHMI